MSSVFQGRDFLTFESFAKEEIVRILDLADAFKAKLVRREPHECLRGRTLAMLFEKHSTRTQLSLQVAGTHLGATTFFMDPRTMQLSRGETIYDTARVIDRYCDALVIRTFEQAIVEEYARHMAHPVINALTNERHPLQLLADLQTVREHKGRLHDLRIAFVGDAWNMACSWAIASAIFGLNMTYAAPEGYGLDATTLSWVQAKNVHTGGSFKITQDLRGGVTGADIVVAVTFTSMRRDGYAAGGRERRLKDFLPYQVTPEVMGWAKPDAVFMHCLPARRGEEVAPEVIDGPRSLVMEEVENRLHTEKAVLALLLGGEV